MSSPPLNRPSRDGGKVVTFYSYKGGTGRTMALANIGWLLASNGYRVLLVDWDLEAPGLHRYLHPFLEDPELSSSPGLIDWATDVLATADRSVEPRSLLHVAGDDVRCVAWSPDNSRLASGTESGRVRIWDPQRGSSEVALPTTNGGVVTSVAWSPDGSHLASVSGGIVRISAAANGATLWSLDEHAGLVTSVAWSPAGTHFASAGIDGTVRVWSNDGDPLMVLEGPGEGQVSTVAWSPDGSQLASAGTDSTVRLWDAATGVTVELWDQDFGSQRAGLGGSPAFLGLAWSPDGRELAASTEQGEVLCWETGAGAGSSSSVGGHAGRAWGVAWSPGGRLLASVGEDGAVLVRDGRSRDHPLLADLRGRVGELLGLSWSPDGTKLATAGGGNQVQIWDLSGLTAEVMAEPEPVEGSWWDPLASLTSHTVAIDYPFPREGLLHLVPAGRQDAGYAVKVNQFDWQRFYQVGGGVLLEAVKREWREDYDVVLVDSRTGLADTSGICTVQLPDELVVCFTLNHQSITGAAAVAESVHRHRTGAHGEPTITVWPLLCRIELAEHERLEAAREAARSAFGRFLGHLSRGERNIYWSQAEVLYQAFFAYEEVLATAVEQGSSTLSILTPYMELARRLVGARSLQRPDLPRPDASSCSAASAGRGSQTWAPDARSSCRTRKLTDRWPRRSLSDFNNKG